MGHLPIHILGLLSLKAITGSCPLPTCLKRRSPFSYFLTGLTPLILRPARSAGPHIYRRGGGAPKIDERNCKDENRSQDGITPASSNIGFWLFALPRRSSEAESVAITCADNYPCKGLELGLLASSFRKGMLQNAKTPASCC
jgi:hypothetical protein